MNPSRDNLPYRLPLIGFGQRRQEVLFSIRYSLREDLKSRLHTQQDWEAGFALGHLYRLGLGGAKDPAQAREYYRLAAGHIFWRDYRTDVRVSLMKGMVHHHGWGVVKDPVRAEPYFRRARMLLHSEIQSGDARAAHDMAALLFYGLGGDKDTFGAEHYYRIAADAGYIPAQIELADLLMHSPEPQRDPYKAATYYDRIAHANDEDYRHMITDAQYRLGGLYYEGMGRVVDYETAYVWFAIAAASGHAEASERRKALESFLNMAQILNAQRRAREWPLGSGPMGPPSAANSNTPSQAVAPRL